MMGTSVKLDEAQLRRMEISEMLPMRTFNKTGLKVKEQTCFDEEILKFTNEICAKISELRVLKKDKKIIFLRGNYGFGKTAALEQISFDAVKRGIITQSELWSISCDKYTSSESIFRFLAEKAEEYGIRDQLKILQKPNEEFDKRKDAAFKVLFHCKMLVVDDIDASDYFNVSLLDEIANEEIIILCTCSNISSIRSNKTNAMIYHVPLCEFKHPNDDSKFLPEIGDDKTQCVFLAMIKNLGPYYGQVLLWAFQKSILTVDNFNLLVESFDTNSPENSNIEKLFALIFKHLNSHYQQLLFTIASLQIPLPIGDEEPFGLLVDLGLLRKSHINDGKLIIQVPNSVMQMLKGQEKMVLKGSARDRNASALGLWLQLLPNLLQDLTKQAEDHAWPFVPEAWQYKDVIGEQERYNLKDIIHRKNVYADCEEIDILQECLYNGLVEEDYQCAAALLFVMDRFIYWQGSSKFLILMTDYIQKNSPSTAIAPQIVIRKARIKKNEGDIQGAEKVLDSLLQNDRNLGHWVYKTESEHQLVSSVCVQIKGDILRGLGLWTDAAKYLIRSIFGFRNLPKVDKKGWASSLSLLADAFQYMPVEDFLSVMKAPYSLVSSHPILEAIKCVNEAANLSIYSPLFYTKNKRRAGELMYIFSRLLRENSQEQLYYLRSAATELMAGLRCHTSIANLESREQFYEFVFCVHKLAQVTAELNRLQYGQQEGQMKDFVNTLFSLAFKLYDHYCSFPTRIQQDKFSIMLIQTTMLMLNLPKIPMQENQMLPATYTMENLLAKNTPHAKETYSSTDNMKDADAVANDFLRRNDGAKEESCARDGGANIDYAISNNGGNLEDDKSKDGSDAAGENELRYIRDDVTVTTDEGLPVQISSVESISYDEQNKEPNNDLNDFAENEMQLKSKITSYNDNLNPQYTDGGYISDIRNATTLSETDDSISKMNKLTVDDSDDIRNIRNATTASTMEANDDTAGDVHQRDGMVPIIDQLADIGNQETYLTEEDYTTKEDFKMRFKTTLVTIEGHLATKEKNAQEIENALKVMTNVTPKVHDALIWRYDPVTLSWSSMETLVFIGNKLVLGKKEEGNCRDAFMVEYINQEEPFGRYVGKQYKLEKYKNNPRSIKQYKQDVVCQVTSRYYATIFNQTMYRKGLSFGQVQFLPAVVIQLTDVINDPEKYYNVEPYMAGNFKKISNNLKWVIKEDFPGKDLLLAFSHFSFCSSKGKILIVDIQGWTSENNTGATFLTDPQIHTMDKKGFGSANKGRDGFKEFWVSQHPRCNAICKQLSLKRPENSY